MLFTETLDLTELPTFTKLELAEHQLERALKLFLDEKDYVCAITLAGVSEEILGKLLEKDGKEHALGALVNACLRYGEAVYNEEWLKKEFVAMANSDRDDLKHYTDGEAVTIARENAIEMLDRAVDNYWTLTSKETALMRRFSEEVHGH
jgi:hypothetical protein